MIAGFFTAQLPITALRIDDTVVCTSWKSGWSGQARPWRDIDIIMTGLELVIFFDVSKEDARV